MRNYIMVAMVAALGWQLGLRSACADDALAKMDGDVIAKIHFVGIDRIAADPKAAKLNELGALPATAVLRDHVMAKLATTQFRLLEHKLYGQNKNNYTNLLQPLLNDLLHNESYTEVRGPTNTVPELLMAVKLNDASAKVWETNLATVLAAWTGIAVQPIQGDGFTGWELKKHHDPNVIRLLHAGDWVLFGWGWNDIRLQARFVQSIKQKTLTAQFSHDDWIDAMLDWPNFQAYHSFTFPSPVPAKLPRMHLTLQGRKDFVRPTLTVQYPTPLGITLDPWQIPTDGIPDAIASFTAARGIAPWLASLPEVKQLHASQVPNQASVWAMQKVPFETHIALPVKGASNYIVQIAPGLTAELNEGLSKRTVPGEAILTNNQIVIRQIPFLAPYLRAVQDRMGDYILGGLFPSRPSPNAKPMPQALMREVLSKPKLVYYDWEINEVRSQQWHDLKQVYLIASTIPIPNGDLAAEKWIEVAEKLMGNCGTEVSLTAPNELTLVRNAPIGLTGFEMAMLQYWIDAPGFPLEAKYSKLSLRLPGKMPGPPPSH